MRYRLVGLLRLPALTLWVAAGFFMAPGPHAGVAPPVAQAESSLGDADSAQASPWATRSGPGARALVPDAGGVTLRVPSLASRHQPVLHRQGIRSSSARVLASRSSDALVRAGLHVWATTAPPPFRFA